MANVTKLAEYANDARFIRPEEMLAIALQEIKDEELHGSKAILLVLDQGPHGDAYSVGFRSANMKKSEIVALLTVQANAFARDLTNG